jgi:YfiH family protein
MTVTFSDLWQWQYWQGQPYLTCKLLEPWQHGFFTQQFSPQLPENLVHIFNPEIPSYRVKQVHGNRVLRPSEISWEQDQFSSADGVISELPQQAVWVASADCTPVLIADRRTGQVAAVHAGWRGTAQRIVPQAIAQFLDHGSRLANLIVVLGPAISGEVYQVSKDVAIEVGLSLNLGLDLEPTHQHYPDAILAALEKFDAPPISSDPEPDKIRLDVRQVNLLQLEQLDFSPAQIAIAPHCTYQQPEYFFSYRRTQEKKVQWSGIVSREP